MLAGLAALLSLRLSDPTQPAGAALDFPTAECTGGASTAVTFAWDAHPLAQQQWLDLSTHDNGFAPGTFIAGGPLAANRASLTWSGITTGVPHFWRVNALTPSGWVASETGAFVPCGGPTLLWGPLTCQDAFNAVVDFHWAPMLASREQWLDLGLDATFSAGTFVSAGPLDASDQSFRWDRISGNTTYFFRVNALGADGVWHSTQVGSFNGNCASYNTELYESADRLVITRLNVNAPVNVRDVGPDGALGNPRADLDVVRYNFGLFPVLSGYPGNGGTTMIAGHVDYIDRLAVFHALRSIQQGDIIEYRRADGMTVTYQVDWFDDLPPDYDWNSLALRTQTESLVLITCNGVFNTAERNYSHRRVAHAIRLN